MSDWPNINEAVPYGWTGGAAFLGRLMFHARQVQMGKRKPLTWALLWDLPIALAMGWIVYGFCVWFDLMPQMIISASIIASYLGPYSVDRVFVWAGKKYFGVKDDA